MTTFVGICSQCLERIENEKNSVTTGYATYEGNKVCYRCCADIDKEYMQEHGRIALYLTKKDKRLVVGNWPSSLQFNVMASHTSTTNWGLTRTDVWFMFDGNVWWGYHVGHNSDIVHCRRTKRTRL